MEEQAAFIDAIRDAPDEDAHRLVYADWLDEHGQPEPAAFIRAHVVLARFHDWGGAPVERTGQLDSMALTPAVRDVLLAPFAPLTDLLAPAQTGIPAQTALQRAYLFLAHRGLIETVCVGYQGALAALADRPEVLRLAPVRFVGLHHQPWWVPAPERPVTNQIGEAALGAFLSSEAINYLEAVDLRRLFLTEAHVAVIIRHAKPLRRVRLRLYIQGGATHPTSPIRRLNEAFGPQLITLPPITVTPLDDEIPF